MSATESTGGGLIFTKIPMIMAEVGHVSKDRKNTQQGYSFRGVDDVYQAVQMILSNHGVFSVPFVESDRTEERTTKGGSALIYRVLTIRFRFYAGDGSYFDARVIGEGMDSGDKASNKAMSVADKYALLQVFKIPTAEAKDPENESQDLEPHGRTQPPSPPKISVAAPPPDEPEIHDDKNAVHRSMLINFLKERKVPDGIWSTISKRLHGRPPADTIQVIAEVRAEAARAAEASRSPFIPRT